MDTVSIVIWVALQYTRGLERRRARTNAEVEAGLAYQDWLRRFTEQLEEIESIFDYVL